MDKETTQHILNILRRGTTTWSGRSLALKLARKRVLEANGKWKYYWQCRKCKCWKRDVSEVEVDHIIEVGSFTGDLLDYIHKLYCGQDNLQVLCIECHLKKTTGYNASIMYRRKNGLREGTEEG